jgi:hypothetical protein
MAWLTLKKTAGNRACRARQTPVNPVTPILTNFAHLPTNVNRIWILELVLFLAANVFHCFVIGMTGVITASDKASAQAGSPIVAVAYE